MHTRCFAAGAAVVVMAAAAGCGGNPTGRQVPSSRLSSTSPAPASAPTSVAENPYGTIKIDPPAPGEPVLTVNGGSTPLALTMDQLNALGNVTITIDEPFVKKRQTFRGVPLAVVLTHAGVSDSATIDTVALNDYHYSSAVAPLEASRALLATTRDGAPIPYDQGGPVRIVFPDGTPLSTVLDAWNWSLVSINVTGAGPRGS